MSTHSPDGTRYCRTCGFTGCPSLTDAGGCPRWTTGIFGAITDPGQLQTLARKLSRAGSAFYGTAEAIGSTTFLLEETGRISVLSPEWDGFWALRELYVDALLEVPDL